MRRRTFNKLLGATAATAVLGRSGLLRADEPFKAGFIYVGPVADYGFSHQHDEGRKQAQETLGDKIKTTFVESVKEGPDSERVIHELAASGNGIIFTTSFGFMNPTIKVAKDFPKVYFEHCTGYKRADNVATYNIRFYEGRYIQGQIAAKMSKSGVLGYIVSFPIPEVIMGINATMLGAQTVNPNIKVKIIWVNTWFDPGKEADAAKALLDQGADVIMQHTDSPAAMKIAAERGKLAVGQDSEMIKFGPTTQLTSIIDNWAPYYIARVKAELDGTWKEEDTWGGLKSQMVVMAPFTNMPDDVKKLAEDTKAAIIDGKLLPFKCPVVDQDGKTVECKGGDHLDDGQVLGMHFYVKGVDDKMPAK